MATFLSPAPGLLHNALHWVDLHDQQVMRRLNRWRAPRWMRLWMIAATRGGDGWLWYATGTIVAIFGGPRRIQALGSAVVAIGLGIILFLRLKRFFNRK